MNPFTTDPDPKRTADVQEAERIIEHMLRIICGPLAPIFFPAREKRAKQAN